MRLGRVIREFRAVPAFVPGHVHEWAGRDARPRDLPVERGVVAWRFWRVRGTSASAWCLASASAPYRWQGPAVWNASPPVACDIALRQSLRARSGGDAPHFEPLGFHAYKSWHRAADSAVWIAKDSYPAGAYGPCELLGRAVEHEDGYRAQGMAVRDLYLVSGLSERVLAPMAADLERRYACDVRVVPVPPDAAARAARLAVSQVPPRVGAWMAALAAAHAPTRAG